MGVAAYQRGSKAISESIQRDFDERNKSARNVEILERLEKDIEKFNEFSTKAQALFKESIIKENAKGFLKNSIYVNWHKKKDTKKVKMMFEECCAANLKCEYCNISDSLKFRMACHRKANAWYVLLETLNDGFRYPFDTPSL